MIILHEPGQDRLIDTLYAWVVTDPRTGLEGVCGINLGPTDQMQAVTSSLDMAHKVGNIIKGMPLSDKRFKLVRFTRGAVLEEL